LRRRNGLPSTGSLARHGESGLLIHHPSQPARICLMPGAKQPRDADGADGPIYDVARDLTFPYLGCRVAGACRRRENGQTYIRSQLSANSLTLPLSHLANLTDTGRVT